MPRSAARSSCLTRALFSCATPRTRLPTRFNDAMKYIEDTRTLTTELGGAMLVVKSVSALRDGSSLSVLVDSAQGIAEATAMWSQIRQEEQATRVGAWIVAIVDKCNDHDFLICEFTLHSVTGCAASAM